MLLYEIDELIALHCTAPELQTVSLLSKAHVDLAQGRLFEKVRILSSRRSIMLHSALETSPHLARHVKSFEVDFIYNSETCKIMASLHHVRELTLGGGVLQRFDLMPVDFIRTVEVMCSRPTLQSIILNRLLFPSPLALARFLRSAVPNLKALSFENGVEFDSQSLVPTPEYAAVPWSLQKLSYRTRSTEWNPALLKILLLDTDAPVIHNSSSIHTLHLSTGIAGYGAVCKAITMLGVSVRTLVLEPLLVNHHIRRNPISFKDSSALTSLTLDYTATHFEDTFTPIQIASAWLETFDSSGSALRNLEVVLDRQHVMKMLQALLKVLKTRKVEDYPELRRFLVAAADRSPQLRWLEIFVKKCTPSDHSRARDILGTFKRAMELGWEQVGGAVKGGRVTVQAG
ncbi:hypothetical protein D9611_013440 [Ephemerocybe angulata]|uniref:Uncharacterized protein n=1 Tax=Ephemerocybe angulata TaxID=980116 RepID=A0A8H5FB47_9AGAR|nr:hypothetical protein D9611_013440 [Tulosesus angulatus]